MSKSIAVVKGDAPARKLLMSRRVITDASELTPTEIELALRWCILNAWGWLSDMPKPSDNTDRRAAANAEMYRVERAVGKHKIMLVWNSEHFDATKVQKAYGS